MTMDDAQNIIAVRKRDTALAHKEFTDLMGRTEEILNREAYERPLFYRSLTASTLETCALEKIRMACQNSPFDAAEVKLVSGQRFPDIIAEQYYGVEVKSTKEDHWTSTGSSIVETTRVENVEDIYMLFGKLGGEIPRFKCRPYQDVLYDIAVTHSPRYLINMQLNKEETIFAKMGTTYEEFRTSADNIALARKFYREKSEKAKRKEMPWWITADNVDKAHSFNIVIWNSLETERKRELKAQCMILFPEALNPAPSHTKYNNTTLWLCSCNQVVVPNVRDLYSAGGSITHVNGKKLPRPVAQVFNMIVEYSDTIKEMLSRPTKELYAMIEEYNNDILKYGNLYEGWLTQCEGIAERYEVPLREWIETKPKFLFSK